MVHCIDYQSGSELGDSNSDQQAPETQAETGICESDGSPPPKRPALEPSNLGQCVDDEIAHYANGSVSLNTETRFNLLTRHFKPPTNFTFPKGTNGRSFQHRWLQTFPWLVYSRQAIAYLVCFLLPRDIMGLIQAY